LCDASALSDSGGNDSFSYKRENADSEYFLVSPADDPVSQPTAVSEGFLGLVLQGGPVDEATKFKLLTQYPKIMAGIYKEKMEANYPDSRVEFDTPFESYQDGTVTLIQDPLATPYIQVSLKLPSGEVETFSLNRDIVESVLTDKNIDNVSLLAALQSFPYRLPEQARSGFEHLTASNIFEMAEQHVEGVKRQEFVKTRQWYERHPEMRAASITVAPPLNSPPTPEKKIKRSKHLPPSKSPNRTAVQTNNITKKTQSPKVKESSATDRATKLPLTTILLLGSALIAGICILVVIRREN